jgi:hypothetical protein
MTQEKFRFLGMNISPETMARLEQLTKEKAQESGRENRSAIAEEALRRGLTEMEDKK